MSNAEKDYTIANGKKMKTNKEMIYFWNTLSWILVEDSLLALGSLVGLFSITILIFTGWI